MLIKYPALLEFAPAAIQEIIKNLGNSPIPPSRIRSLLVDPRGWSKLDPNVLIAIRSRAKISVTPELFKQLETISQQKTNLWNWKPARVSSISPQHIAWQGPIEHRDIHRIERGYSGQLEATPTSKFLETEIANAEFCRWWDESAVSQALVAVCNTGATKGDVKMTVVGVTCADENADVMDVLKKIGVELTPISEAAQPCAKALVYTAAGKVESFVPRTGKRRREEPTAEDAAPPSPLPSADVMSDSE